MKKLLYIVPVIMLLAAGCNSSQQVSNPAPVTQNTNPAPTTTPPASTDETANWKVYTNTKYGFEVKYPQSWKVGTPNDGSIYFMANNGQDASMSVYVFDKPASEAEKLMPVFSVPGRKIDSRTNVSVNGISWEKLVVEKNQVVQLTYHNGQTFGEQNSTFEDISPKILSTFKFTK